MLGEQDKPIWGDILSGAMGHPRARMRGRFYPQIDHHTVVIDGLKILERGNICLIHYTGPKSKKINGKIKCLLTLHNPVSAYQALC